jgi:hypothetical protein
MTEVPQGGAHAAPKTGLAAKMWPTWQVALIAGAILVGALGVGFGIGTLASDNSAKAAPTTTTTTAPMAKKKPALKPKASTTTTAPGATTTTKKP